MRGNSVLSVIVITLSLLVLSSNSASAVSKEKLTSLFATGQKSEDTSYTAALESYEALNRLLVDLNDRDRQSLKFAANDGRSITTFAFVDSFLPLARRKAVAETDIFECALLVAESIPDKCTKCPGFSDSTLYNGLYSRTSLLETLMYTTAEKCFLDWTERVWLDLRSPEANREARALFLKAVSAYQCSSDSAVSLVDSAIHLSLKPEALELILEDNLAGQILQALVGCKLDSKYPDLIDQWESIWANSDALKIGVRPRFKRDLQRTLAKAYLDWGYLEQARDYTFRSAGSIYLLDITDFVKSLYRQLLLVGDTASALELLLEKSEVAYQPETGRQSYDGWKFVIAELYAIGVREKADSLFAEVEDHFRTKGAQDDIQKMADFYICTGARESASRLLDSVYAVTPIDSINRSVVRQLLYSYLQLGENDKVWRILSSYPANQDRDYWIQDLVSISKSSPESNFAERLVGLVSDAHGRGFSWLSYIGGRGNYQGMDYAEAVFAQIEDPTEYVVTATYLLIQWPRFASYPFASRTFDSRWPSHSGTDWSMLNSLNSYQVIFWRADEFALSSADRHTARTWFRNRFIAFLNLGDIVHAKQSLDYERGLPVLESSLSSDSIGADELCTLAQHYAVIGELESAKEVLGEVLESISRYDYGSAVYDHDYDLRSVVVAYTNIGATDLALKASPSFKTSSELATGLAEIAIAHRSIGSQLGPEGMRLLHELLESRLQ